MFIHIKEVRKITIIDFFKSIFTPGKRKENLTFEDMESYLKDIEASKFFVAELALFTAIDLIARTVAKCEFVTVMDNQEVKNEEYYLWNYHPNKHQTKFEFITQFISTLIIKNEALIIETSDRQLFVADGFSQTKHALLDDEFKNVSVRGYTFPKTHKSSEVIYLKYSNIAVAGLIRSMCQSYERLMGTAEKRYNKAIGHKGTLEIDSYATNDDEFKNKFEDLLNNRFKKFFNAQDAVLPLYEGYKYTELKNEADKTTNNEVNDIQKLRSEAVNATANAFHIPPSILKGEASQLSDAVDTYIANAVDTVTKPLAQEITEKRNGKKEFVKGNFLLIDTTYAKHIDAITSANNIDKAIASGVLTPGKAQSYAGMLPSNEPFAKEHYLTKNYQTAKVAVAGEGGENNAE